MAKAIAEQSNALSIFWLKKHGFLNKDCSFQSGSIKWTYGLSESSIGFAVIRDNWGTSEEETYIELRYTYTNRWSNKKEDLNYKVRLTTTPCNYGGVRYWFVCPLMKNGQPCGKRVGVLYSLSKYFGCRHCGGIAYRAQMKGGKYRGSSVSIPDIERLEKEIKRYYYRGKPARKYRQLMRMNYKLRRDLVLAAARFDKKFEGFANPYKKRII